MALGAATWAEARGTVTRLLSATQAVLRDDTVLQGLVLADQVRALRALCAAG